MVRVSCGTHVFPPAPVGPLPEIVTRPTVCHMRHSALRLLAGCGLPDQTDPHAPAAKIPRSSTENSTEAGIVATVGFAHMVNRALCQQYKGVCR
jgi:hypothetical protein